VLAIWCAGVAGLLVTIHIYGGIDHAQKADVIIVLGAGLRRNDQPGPALTRRSERAADLWQQGLATSIICTGGITGKASRSEAAACGDILLANGVPEAAMVLEERSRSTEENALYTREIMQLHGWRTAILVSDSFHILRGQWLFGQHDIDVYTSPVPARDMLLIDYVLAMGREVGAFHWQVVKQLLGLPNTYVGGL
jgi:uncharacterized SAM-binding protein YcdF (DUF218 family)